MSSPANLTEVIAWAREKWGRRVDGWQKFGQLADAAEECARLREQNLSLRNMMPPHEHEQICEELRRQVKRLELDLADAHREYNRQSRQTSESARRLERELAAAWAEVERLRSTTNKGNLP